MLNEEQETTCLSGMNGLRLEDSNVCRFIGTDARTSKPDEREVRHYGTAKEERITTAFRGTRDDWGHTEHVYYSV